MNGWLRPALIGLLAACGAAVIFAAAAQAHADLLEAQPAAGSTVDGSFTEVRLTFSEPLLAGSQIALHGEQFRPVGDVTTVVAGSKMRGLLTDALQPGAYTVAWSAISRDMHIVSGSYPFSVSAPAAPSAFTWTRLIAMLVPLIAGGVALLVFILNRRSRL